MMKWFTDGDRVVVTKDDFVDLQESPAVFVSSDSRAGRAIVLYGIRGLALEDLRTMEEMLDCGGGDWINRGSKVHMEKIHRGHSRSMEKTRPRGLMFAARSFYTSSRLCAMTTGQSTISVVPAPARCSI